MKKVQEQVCVSDRSPQGNAMSHRARGNHTCARADRAAASAREYHCADRWTRKRASSRPVQLVYGAKCPAPAGFRSAVAASLAAERQSGLTLNGIDLRHAAIRRLHRIARCPVPTGDASSPKPPPASAATPPCPASKARRHPPTTDVAQETCEDRPARFQAIGGVLFEHAGTAGGVQLIGLRIGALVLGGDPVVPIRRLGVSGVARIFVQIDKVCINGRLQRWPGCRKGRGHVRRTRPGR